MRRHPPSPAPLPRTVPFLSDSDPVGISPVNYSIMVPRGAGGLHPDLANSQHCTSWLMLMVPKTGSSFLTEFYRKSDCCQRLSWRFHDTLYRPCSLATLREPCERAISSYAHLRSYYPGHWPNAPDVNHYVERLAQNWAHIANYAQHGHLARNSGDRNLILAIPQHFWIGNASRVLCSEDIDAELPSTFRALGCCRVPSNTSIVKQKLGKLGSIRTSRSHTLTPQQANMSAAACATVRKLYWRDAELYERICMPAKA